MKKFFIGFATVIIIAIVLFMGWYYRVQNENAQIKSYNLKYNSKIGKEINGVDLTTLMNKAIDNNVKYKLSKNENNVYINDNEYYTEITIKLDEEEKPFLMEAFEMVGIETFTRLYGNYKFKCTDIKYHKNGRISQINYQIIK